LSAFTTAKGRLSINAMLSSVCGIVDGDGRCKRWLRWTMRAILAVRHNVPLLGSGSELTDLGASENSRKTVRKRENITKQPAN
jgi:hypothetical protein